MFNLVMMRRFYYKIRLFINGAFILHDNNIGDCFR